MSDTRYGEEKPKLTLNNCCTKAKKMSSKYKQRVGGPSFGLLKGKGRG